LAILRTPYASAEPSEWLAEKTGIPAVMLPYTVGGDPQSGDLFALFERTLGLLEAQLDQP
jgi:zinc/manganese transport system substrate-binding protein